jgi:arylsulfatase A-like enzyme
MCSRYCLALLACLLIDDLSAAPPHIVFILADDLGWSDVGWHGGEIVTQHLDRLAATGAKLEQHYVLPVCSPTRAALMTGRYPMRHGLQVGVVRPWAQYGLPLEERTLPQALRQVGYRTAIVGKWHLGHFAAPYLPTQRGFDHQYGHYNGALDYFTHQRDGGHDWHRNDRVCRDEGYTTTLLGDEAVRIIEDHDLTRPLFLYVPFNAPHTPLQAPQAYLDRYAGIANNTRRTYCAMVHAMDEQVGRIVSALQARELTEKTLVVFSSDNGGPTSLGATNGGLRAGKGTLYEGGVRVPAFACWPGVIPSGTIHAPIHVSDWFPTLVRVATGTIDPAQTIDGRDVWETILGKAPSPHDAILINASPTGGAIRSGDWKLIVDGEREAKGLKGDKKSTPRVELFNLSEDPYERTDLSSKYTEKVRELQERLDRWAAEAVPPKAEGQPANYKAPAVWGTFFDE